MIKLLVVGLTGLLAAACVPGAPPLWLVQPAEPHLGNRSPRYVSVTAGVQRFGVVEPKDWRELNRAVGPQPGQSGGMQGMPGMSMPDRNKPQGGRSDRGKGGTNMPGMNMPGVSN